MKYLFVDIETTGLDESEGYILEVALVAVTEDFEVLDCTNFIVDYNGHRGITQRQVFYENTNEITMEMHSKNGLKEEFCNGDLQTRVKISEVAQHISRASSRLPRVRGRRLLLALAPDRQGADHSSELDTRGLQLLG